LETTLGSRREYQPHKLILAVLVTPKTELARLDQLIADRFGDIEQRSDPFEFTFTSYYEDEMGPRLSRLLYSFRQLTDPTALAELKSMSNAVESETAGQDGGRSLNLDPGLLSLSRVILATTKASAHRVPIGLSMYAEITLLYRRGKYESLEWTYPDFRSDLYHEWLLAVRTRYHEQLRDLDPARNWRL
jgi:hypothetical protein